MTTDLVRQLGLLTLEGVVVSSLLLGLFWLRHRFGLALLFTAIGVLQPAQVILAQAIYLEILPGWFISPGSTVIFTGSLFAVLLVYIREDAGEARRLVLALLLANITLAILLLLLRLHLSSPLLRDLLGIPVELFSPRVVLVGTLVLLVDVLVMIVAYEWVSRWLGPWLFVRIFAAMTLVLILDTVLFTLGSFWGKPELAQVLLASTIAKVGSGLIYSVIMTAYLYGFERSAEPVPVGGSPGGALGIFDLLTYRQKFEVLQKEAARDALTGLYNRRSFDDLLAREIELFRRLGQPLSLMMLDLDRFKAVNDRYGHQEGDRVLGEVGRVLADTARISDLPCRYGGEEFAIVLPHTKGDAAVELARRIRQRLRDVSRTADDTDPAPLTVTIGISSFPHDGVSGPDLVEVADRRLYRGKALGRDRIIAPDAGTGSRSMTPVPL